MSRGVCGKCFDEFRLADGRVPEHNSPRVALECLGSNTVALDEESGEVERLLDVIAAAVWMGNSAHMSEKNKRRVARSVYYNLKKVGALR